MILTIHEAKTFTPLTKITAFSDLAIFWRYHEPGELRLTLPVNSGIVLRSEMLIHPFNGALTLGNEAFLAETVEIKEQEDGDFLSLTAYSASVLLARRYLEKAYFFEGTGGAVIKKLLDSAFADPDRQYPGKFDYDIDETLGEEVTYETQPANLLDAIITVCRASGLGFNCEFDPYSRTLMFRLRYGREDGQDGKHIVFDSAYRNINNILYTDSTRDLATMVYVLGEREKDTDVRKTVVCNPNGVSGFDRYEIALESGKTSTTDEKKPDGTNVVLTDAQYRQLLMDYGMQQLAIRTRTKKAEGQLNVESGHFVFGKDFFLGDIVTVRSRRWGASVLSRLTEIVEDYSQGMRRVHVTVGDRAPIFNEQIKRR